MNINYTLPLIWKHRRDWFSGGREMLLDVGWVRMCIRSHSYDLYILGEIFWSRSIPAPGRGCPSGGRPGPGRQYWRLQPVGCPALASGQDLAVEMDPDNFRLLEQNICLNDLAGKILPCRSPYGMPMGAWVSGGMPSTTA